MDYNFNEIEPKWQAYWQKNNIFKVEIDPTKPKYYVLDMFPYPSGAGLHVGHPLGYIASDIYSRYKRLKGFNVLHPMGYDAYGLPAEQYAIQTGQHPAITTEKNIARYREQLDKIGFSFDWSREVRTSDPNYYKWTQWVFIQLFEHWYNTKIQKAEPIAKLVEIFEKEGNASVCAHCSETPVFTAQEWRTKNEKQQQEILMNYRLTYLADTPVNWCPALGTVLANDEVVNGVSVRGGHPVEKKLMRQWSLRITAYAERILAGLDSLDWSDSLKEIQRNWIGRSEGATAFFQVSDKEEKLEIFTTRPDTIFGVTFMVLCPEHEYVSKLTTAEHKTEVAEYLKWAKNRSERERLTEVKKVSGVFTGSYAVNPLTGKKIPIWISDYVLAGYGTGAIMAVPAHDSRDFAFARHFNLPITQVIVPSGEKAEDTALWEESKDSKEGTCINSGFIDGMPVKKAITVVINSLEEKKIGTRKINYRLRDAIFSRQRYWGEPFPVFYKDGMPYMLNENELPLLLPAVDKYLPTETGEPPLARAQNWQTKEGYPLETSTMPGFAGSSAYYFRYMDPRNDKEIFSQEAVNYWQSVDLYVGGAEHATGHLLYARFWNKFLFDLGLCPKDEPFAKLINQGMIQGRSNFVYRVTVDDLDKNLIYHLYASINIAKEIENAILKCIEDEDNLDNIKTLINQHTPILNNVKRWGIQLKIQKIHVDINLVDNDILDIEKFRQWMPEFANAKFLLEDGKYICGWEVEKMSKSLYNVQNPDDLIERYGADTLRLYEMFLGPIEQAKPWDIKGIEGVARFIRKAWKLFHDTQNDFEVSNEQPTEAEFKILHKTIKKIQEDIERFSFNTSVSSFMICANELTDLKCNKREILEPLCILMSAFTPHITEELWQLLGHKESIALAKFPQYNEKYLMESNFSYPVSFNGKTRFMLELPVDLSAEEVEKRIIAEPEAQKWFEGKAPKKIVFVPKKIINVVL